MFIEAEGPRYHSLQAVLGALELPSNIKYQVYEGRFDEEMTEILDQLDEEGARMAPGFFLLDPFGYSHTPMSTVKRVMEHPRCEVLITFIYENLNRFLSSPDC